MAVTVAVIDGLGGGIGAQIVEQLVSKRNGKLLIWALGANASATQRMVNAGADKGASGENAIKVSVGNADYILGPIGIILNDSMMGEISPVMVSAIFASPAKKILIPIAQSHIALVGMSNKPLADLISEAVTQVLDAIKGLH